jgi:hypothetical protein
MSTVSPTAALINSAGISAPPFAGILAWLVSQRLAIFGSDSYLGPATQEGQWLGVLAQAASDANAAAINCYQSFSPATAQGAALSSNVQINGLQRLVPSNSTVTLTITGVAGTIIANGVLSDSAGGYRWDLPPSVVIGLSGTVTATATCETVGAIQAALGTVTGMAAGLTAGWQAVTNPAAAAPGAPVEADGTLRIRQATSTTLPSLGVMDGIVGALWAVPGVVAVAAYSNLTGSTNSNGLPANSICFVVEGGSATAIAAAIATKKTPGIPTYGTTLVNVAVAWSATTLPIYFIVPAQVVVKVTVTLQPAHQLHNLRRR